jgi:hypothetical protein
MPYGYNFKRAVKDVVRAPYIGYRVYGFRDMSRRLAYLSDLLDKHTLTLANAHLLFQGYNSRYTVQVVGLP